MPPRSVLLVGAGGALGTLARHLITVVSPAPLPVAILVINVIGAFTLALVLGRLRSRPGDPAGVGDLRLLVGTGFLGGFTTYSALALDSVQFWHAGSPVAGVAYPLATLVLGAVATGCGRLLGGHR